MIWLIAAMLVVVFQFVDFAAARTPRLRASGLPVSRVHSNLEAQWRYLREAAEAVPPGASYTIAARDPDTEMSLLMLSLGVLLDRRPSPATYFNRPMRGGGRDARFILAFGGLRPSDERVRMVRNTRWGQVYERVP